MKRRKVDVEGEREKGKPKQRVSLVIAGLPLFFPIYTNTTQ